MDPIGLHLGANGESNGIPAEQPYSIDAIALEKELLDSYPSAKPQPSQPLTYFLTGATGFLGPYIIRDLLSRPRTRVIAHIRAKNEDVGQGRVETILRDYGIWSDDWQSRLSCVIGDLKEPRLGMSEENWEKVVREADFVIHNGAQVHWVYPCKSGEHPFPFPFQVVEVTVRTRLLTTVLQTTHSNQQTSSAPLQQCPFAQPANQRASFTSARQASSIQIIMFKCLPTVHSSLSLTTSKAVERGSVQDMGKANG